VQEVTEVTVRLSADPAQRVPVPRVAVSLSPPGPGPAFRVDSPGRVLRLWSLLNAAAGEAHAEGLPRPARDRLQRVLTGVSVELGQCLSPALAEELGGLLGPGTAVPDADELRIDYSLLLGWLGGLVIGILDQLEAAGRNEELLSRQAVADQPFPR
jgi:hypothetical protein